MSEVVVPDSTTTVNFKKTAPAGSWDVPAAHFYLMDQMDQVDMKAQTTGRGELRCLKHQKKPRNCRKCGEEHGYVVTCAQCSRTFLGNGVYMEHFRARNSKCTSDESEGERAVEQAKHEQRNAEKAVQQLARDSKWLALHPDTSKGVRS